MHHYDHKSIEKKWQQAWDEAGVYKVEDNVEEKENDYTLVEFSYPSGNLHIGHWYAFALPDVFVRYKKMLGYNTLYPMGFDSFGLPAENAAIKRGLDPREWTYSNMELMKTQLKSMGACFDWSREIKTSDPEYYKWNQWLFTKFFENDIAYQTETEQNWCESCKTVLANEQVIDGTCERCDNTISKKTMNAWNMRITDFADELIDDLDSLSWPEHIKDSQKNWIGRSEGAEITFSVNQSDTGITVFTTRADTLYGVTFLVLAPEAPLTKELLESCSNKEDVLSYIKKTESKTERERLENKEKTGVALEGLQAINPINQEKIPIFIADYVLAGYGTGAIMAVPAHDDRDAEFTEVFGLDKREVVDENERIINSEEFDGMTIDDAKSAITKKVGGKITKTYRLRDWSVSRQRYWGCPIPIVYDPEGKAHAIAKEHLPWILPDDVDHTPDGTAPLARSQELKKRTTEIFGEGWTPEVETFDTFVDSSWYFYRYLDAQNDDEFASSEKIKNWMPITRYLGGAEHTTMHLLYSRFWVKAMHKLGLVDHNEPYSMRINRGLILGPDGNKMSKSKGNVIDPDEQVELLGADTVRAYLAFLGPYTGANYPWKTDDIAGVRRFLEKVWRLHENLSGDSSSEVSKQINKTIQKVGTDYSEYKFNTALAAMMSFMKVAEKENISQEDFGKLLTILNPLCPHITEELWHNIGNDSLLVEQVWPEVDKSLLVDDTVTIGVQVNGKRRGDIEIPPESSQDEAVAAAQQVDNISKWISEGEVRKVIYVPGKILNIIVG